MTTAFHLAAFPLLALPLLIGGCDDMTRQPRRDVWDAAPAELDRLPAGRIAFSRDGIDQDAVPPVTLSLLQRGQQRFHVYCAPCHSELGDGHGMIVQRGFPAPPSYDIERLRTAPPRHFYDVITNGYGAMYSFAARIDPPDRWAIAAYVKALQHSRHATLADVPEAQRASLQ